MEPVELKTIAELIDQLITTNVKIWHLVDSGYAGDGNAAVKAQRMNERRGMLMRAINNRLDSSQIQLDEKVYSDAKG